MKHKKKRGESSGLTPDELAFYDALNFDEEAKGELSDDVLRQIARELTNSLKNNMSVDWNIRSSVQSKMKMIIKRRLKKYGYPHDKRDAATETVLEQAKLMCVNESVHYGENNLRSGLKAAEE